MAGDRAAGPAPALGIRLLGQFEVRLAGKPLPPLRTRKSGWLLALLALHPGADLDRAWLSATLWPDSSESQGFYNLRRSLADLRRALGPEARRLRSSTPHTLSLDLTGAEVDLRAFDVAIARGHVAELERAVSLYRGPLLDGCGEEWAVQGRQAREQAYLGALESLAAAALARGEAGAAERRLREAVAADPLRESAQRGLMAAMAAGGNTAAALLVFRELRSLLHRELNAEPDPETRTLFEQIRAQARQGSLLRGAREGITSPRRHGDTENDTEKDRREGPNSSVSFSVSPCLRGERSFPSSLQADLEPVGGAVPLDSPFYVVRSTDAAFRAAIARQDSIVLVKGARQIGKTSLLARGLHQAREAGTPVLLTDLQLLHALHLESAEALLRGMAEWIAAELDLAVSPEEGWNPLRGPSVNFQRYFRSQVLDSIPGPIVWGLDQVDRLFPCAFASEIFGMFRFWHNARSLDPNGPWSRLTLAMAYATEAHLFITDIHQSPFNVGTRLTLEDFTCEQVADLNQRYGSPLRDEEEVRRYYRLVGGHPYLVRCGLHEMATQGFGIAALEEQMDRSEGIYGDHLRRLCALLIQEPELCEAVRQVLQGRECPSPDSFYRLRSAGVIVGEAMETAQPRCHLYATYLARHLL